MDGIHRARRKRTPGSETVKRLAHVGQFGRSLRPNREVWHHALSLGLIRFRGQFDYAACLSVNRLSNSAGLT